MFSTTITIFLIIALIIFILTMVYGVIRGAGKASEMDRDRGIDA